MKIIEPSVSKKINTEKKIRYLSESLGIKYIADKIKAGKIAILPTSTIYGISCVYNDIKVLEKVYEIKKRPLDMPFIILIPEIFILNYLCEDINRNAQKLINKYWLSDNPEPLTLVFKKSSDFKKNYSQKATPLLKNNSDKLAIRLDAMPQIIRILKICGPVISTSATVSGTDISPKLLNEIPETIKNNVDIIFDYEKSLSGIASTIIDVTKTEPVLLREGKLKFKEIISFLNQSKF